MGKSPPGVITEHLAHKLRSKALAEGKYISDKDGFIISQPEKRSKGYVVDKSKRVFFPSCREEILRRNKSGEARNMMCEEQKGKEQKRAIRA